MKLFRRQENLWSLLRQAAASEPIPAEGHLIEDDQLLTCWSMGLLRPEEKEEFFQHLAVCPRCRQELMRLIQAGVVEPPPLHEPEVPPASSPDLAVEGQPCWPIRPPAVRAKRFWAAVCVAAAACLLGAFGLLLWFGKPNGLQTTLAAVQQELQENRPEAALERLEVLVARQPELVQEPSVRQLLEEASWQAARQHLQAKRFSQVLEIEARLATLLGPTARLVNLRIQAQRGMTREVALAEAGVLLAYGYEPDGRSWTMALPTIDATMDRLDRELEEACRRFPEEPTLWLNWGQFLLSIARPTSAKECFQRAARLAPNSPLPWTGLGLAAFEQGAHQEALEYFQQALRLGPEDISARLNLAICLYRLGQRSEALEQFQHVLRQTDAPELRARIQMAIPELQTLEKPQP